MNHPDTVREQFTRECTACGLCAAMCPPLSHRTVQLSNDEIQEQVRTYLGGGSATETVCDRSRLCNECYKCVTDTCPQGLDPMRINQLLRGLLHLDGTDPRPFIPPADPQSSEGVISSLLTTEEEFARITTPAVKGDGRIVFFPGCNIYYQPHLLLTALDICDRVANDWTFLPGLTHCCGNNHDSSGRLAAGAEAMEELVWSLGGSGVQTVVLWCPTCVARFHHEGSDLPVISFARFVADRLNDDLMVNSRVPVAVTLQEACKVGYLGLDPSAPRELLKLVTGAPVREMDRHGTGTVCCGWSLHSWLPAIGDEERRQRLTEAAAAGAETLVTICHGCQEIFDDPQRARDGEADIDVVNYITLVGDVLGVRHEERFRMVRDAGDLEKTMAVIRQAMGKRFDQLPYSAERIGEAVESLLGGFSGIRRPGI